MEALLLPFGSPVKDARTLIASKVDARVKTPGVVDAKAEPEIRYQALDQAGFERLHKGSGP